MRFLLLLYVCCLASLAQAQDGRALIEASSRRHAPPPHVYQELALVITDAHGRYSVRTFRRYGQQNNHWLVVDTPPDLRGMTIRLDTAPGAPGSPVLGSDFRVGDFAPEALAMHDYRRRADERLGRQPHHVVDALPQRPGQPVRRFYLRQDNLFVSRIDYFDSQDADAPPVRRQSFHHPRPDENGVWRPGMMLMEDLRQGEGRRSLLKVGRRVHSPDYLPAAMADAQP